MKKTDLKFDMMCKLFRQAVMVFVLSVTFIIPAYADCLNPSGTAGTQMYNSTHSVMQYCNGTNWISMDGSYENLGGPEPDDLGAASAAQDLNMGAFKVIELGTPTATTDAATKAYVDSKTGAAETDPQVGSVTNNNWCKGTGTQASCMTAAPVADGIKMMVVADERSDGTNGGTATAFAWTNRALNTIRFNNIGASLAANVITLPAGTYYVDASAVFMLTGGVQMRLAKTNGDTLLMGGSGYSSNSTAEANATMVPYLRGVIGFTAPTDVVLQYYVTDSAAGTVMLGKAVAGFGNEVYTVMQISKIAAGAAVTVPEAPCAGVRYGYYCWYLGATNQSCDTVCASRGGCVLEAVGYTGNAGTNANCQAVMNALGQAGTVADSTATTNNYEFLGCNIRGGTKYRYTQSATTCSDAYSTSQRACACGN